MNAIRRLLATGGALALGIGSSLAPAAADGGNLSYGIDDAIQLMRTLPGDNVELVVRVVKSTLESPNIEIKTIIEDASSKQKRIEDRVSVLKAEISELENEIKSRKTEIDGLETDHSETTQVKERLLLAEKLGGGGTPKTTSSQGSGPLGKSGGEPPRPRRSSTTPPPAPGSTSKTTVISKK